MDLRAAGLIASFGPANCHVQWAAQWFDLDVHRDFERRILQEIPGAQVDHIGNLTFVQPPLGPKGTGLPKWSHHDQLAISRIVIATHMQWKDRVNNPAA
jgi:hypothetical protein